MRSEEPRAGRIGACCAAVALVLGCANPAGAEESRERQDLRTVLFGSLDGGSSSFGSLGMKRTLSGSLDTSGPVALLSAGFGSRGERAEPAHAGGSAPIRYAADGSALLGYQWALDRVFLTALAGPEFNLGEETGVRGPRTPGPAPKFGARIHGEVWAHPSETTLLTATAIAGTARGHVWTRLSAGWQAWGRTFIGPEAALYRTESYRELRLGAHATGLEVGRFRLRLSAGWRFEAEARPRGAYFALSGHVEM